jgi:excisionase family DNA binding protein
MADTRTEWLSLEDTATYLGMGKTALYGLARDGRIPTTKVGKKWVFEKAALDAWMRANQPLESFFLNLDFNIEDNDYLRDPQRDG